MKTKKQASEWLKIVFTASIHPANVAKVIQITKSANF